MTLIDDAALLAARATDLADEGAWPIAGGWLDQTQACIDAVAYLRAQDARWRADLRATTSDDDD